MRVRFPLEFFLYATQPAALAIERTKPLRIAYYFLLHIFVAFFVALTMTSHITESVRVTSEKLQQLPVGVVAEKRGSDLKITGLDQPFTLSDGNFVVTIDTTRTIIARPKSTTVFIGAEALEVAGTEGSAAAERMAWSDGDDFVIKFDEVRNLLRDHESAAVTVVTLFVFGYLFVSSLIFSTLLIVVWSLFATVVYRLIYRQHLPVRDALAVHMVAISAPLFLWGCSVVTGLGLAPLVEVIAFVVYSILGLRSGVITPAADGSKK